MSADGHRILLIDDEPDMLESFRRILTVSGHDVATSTESARIAELLADEKPDVVVTDLRMPRLDGMGVLRATVGHDPRIPVIILTAHGTIESAVQAVKEGAFDYLTKPVEHDILTDCIRRAIAHRATRTGSGPAESDEVFESEHLIGQSSAMNEVVHLLRRVARTDANILITGESGTGKEVVARCLHATSHRRAKPFIPVDVASLPATLLESELFGHEKGAFTGAIGRKPGVFELADGGTILLDEIGEMNLSLQVKLLRVVQERCFRRIGGREEIRVDVRILSATNRDLNTACEEGRFRQDLFFRLNVITVDLPPLRQREGDIPLLTKHFFKHFAPTVDKRLEGFTPEAFDLLEAHPWPGNVRELQNAVERAVVLCDGPWITPADLPPVLDTASLMSGRPVEVEGEFHEAKRRVLDHFERDYLVELLRRSDGNISHAATEAGMNRRTLYRLIDKFDIDLEPLRR